MADDKDVKMQRIAGHSEERFLGSDIFESTRHTLPPPRRGVVELAAKRRARSTSTTSATWWRSAAGCAAAWAAAKAGADVTLVERYNCLGGLSTGGLVMWIDRMTDWQGNHAVAANRGLQPRAVDVDEVRSILRSQGAHLSDDAAVATARSAGEPMPAE